MGEKKAYGRQAPSPLSHVEGADRSYISLCSMGRPQSCLLFVPAVPIQYIRVCVYVSEASLEPSRRPYARAELVEPQKQPLQEPAGVQQVARCSWSSASVGHPLFEHGRSRPWLDSNLVAVFLALSLSEAMICSWANVLLYPQGYHSREAHTAAGVGVAKGVKT